MDEKIKREMLGVSENPFNIAYIVDVEVETIRNKPAIYKVSHVHDSFNIKDDKQTPMFK